MATKKMTYGQAKRWLLESGAEVIEVARSPYSRREIAAKFRVTKSLGVFKKVYVNPPYPKPTAAAIANLVVPENAIVILSRGHDGHKCRTNKVFVHSIVEIKNKKRRGTATSWHTSNFTYKKGQWMKPALGFDARTQATCVSGLHFYCDLQSAKEW